MTGKLVMSTPLAEDEIDVRSRRDLSKCGVLKRGKNPLNKVSAIKPVHFETSYSTP
tara:strand:+ start:4398 stop:4565 length:168 start_codon:yes stop_codon:yes gene_type:complete